MNITLQFDPVFLHVRYPRAFLTQFLYMFPVSTKSYTFLYIGKLFQYTGLPLVPVGARSKACVCGRSLAGIVRLNAAGVHGCLSLARVVCCQTEVSAVDRSLVQRSTT